MRWRAARLVLLLTLIPALQAVAHVRLSRSSPSARDTLTVAPASIRLWFTGRAELTFTQVRLVGPGATAISLGPVARLDGTQSAFTSPIVGDLTPGVYTVEWQTAAADGHPVRGQFTFTVAGAAPDPLAAAVAPSPIDTATSIPERIAAAPDDDGDELADYEIARWAEFVALLAVLGAVVFRFAVVGTLERRNEPVADLVDRARQIGLGAVVLLLATGVYRLLTEYDALTAGSASDVTLGTMVTTTSWGHGWLVGAAGAVVLLAGLVAARWSNAAWSLAAIGAFATAVSPALTGHAAADPRTALAITVDAVHVLGAGAWIGTLLLVVIAAVPAALRRVPGERGPAVASILRAFHPLALVCVPFVVLSGVVATWLRLGSWDALFGSRYGTYLLIKVALFVCVALTGAYNWRRVLPTLRDDETSARSIRRSGSLELAFALFVLAMTAALVVTPPPE